MRSCFDLLGLPPRAALDEAELDAAYLEAARAAHPDQEGGDAELSASLNEAAAVLRSPSARLKHLLELNSAHEWRAVPLDNLMMDLFGRLGPRLNAADGLAARSQAAGSALARALLAPEVLRAREDLERLLEEAASARGRLEEELPAMDARMQAGDAAVWKDIHGLQTRLAYLEKWQAQVRQRLMLLMI